MNEPAEQHSSCHLGRTIVAGLILIVAVWMLLGFVIHIVSFLFSFVVFIVLVGAVIWALRVIL
jgi:hypothetical protein